MDVIGNNIANVNTVAYKSSSVTFSEVFYQTTQSASGSNPSTGRGGTNAKQIGLGSNVGAISSSIESEGASQRTDNAFDLKISGSSFFVVQNNGATQFTRAGNFTLDDAGYLVTSTGAYVMGWQIDDATGEVRKDTVTPLQPKSSDFTYTTPEATTDYTISGNINKSESNFVSGDPLPLSVHFYDSLGNEYTATINMTQDADDVNVFNLSLGDIFCNNQKTNLTGTLANATMTFDADTGKPKVGTGVTDANGNESFAFTIQELKANSQADLGVTDEDWASMTIMSTDHTYNDVTVHYSNLTTYADDTAVTGDFGDESSQKLGAGKQVGKLSGISVGTDGSIQGSYSNGDVKVLGQIAVAQFANPSGLEKVGDNYYEATLNSGLFDGIGYDVTATGGSIASGVLEMSNVDLSTEFTEMITTQRGFQANSRIITVSDTLIEELVNLKR
jgi:flagellar hook protein FlgE